MPPPQAAALRRAVVASTAEHMAPGEIRVLAEIPRLANYKPDLVRLDAMLSEPGGRVWPKFRPAAGAVQSGQQGRVPSLARLGGEKT